MAVKEVEIYHDVKYLNDLLLFVVRFFCWWFCSSAGRI